MSDSDAPQAENSSEVAPKPGFSIDRIRSLLASLPKVPKDVALKVADQLPELRRLAAGALERIESMHKKTTEVNDKNQERVHRAYGQIRRILARELDNDDLTFEQKKEIYDLLIDNMDKESAKDSENKRLLTTWLNTGGAIALAALLLVVVMLGGKVAGGKS